MTSHALWWKRRSHLAPLRLSVSQRDAICNYLTKIDLGLNRRSILQKSANSRDNLARPIPVTDDSLKGFSSFVQVLLVAVQPAESGIGIGDDGCQRLVHFMRDG